MKPDDYRPWERESRKSSWYFWAGIAIFLVDWQAYHLHGPNLLSLLLFVLAAGCIWHALHYADRAVWRRHGQSFEKAVLSHLSVPPGWRLKKDIRDPRLGNIDAQIERPDGRRFTIEIKSWQGVSIDRQGRLRRANGRPLDKNPLDQCRMQAAHARATPVLWVPKGQAAACLVDGVIIVMGADRILIDTLIQVA